MGAKLFHDDGTGSLAVGVTLLVATAVVLASTTAAFVLGFGDRANTAPPEANFTYEYSQLGHGNLTIIHESGETLDPGTVEIAADTPFRPAPGNDTGTLRRGSVESYALDGAAAGSEWVENGMASGTEFGIVGESTGSLEGITVRIVWVDPAGGDTVVLGEWRGPDA